MCSVRSGMERGDELLLDVGLDGLVAVDRSHPRHRVVGGRAGQDGEASERCSRATVAPETSHLHPLTLAGAVEQVREDSTQPVDIFGNTEVWPVEVLMRPRRSPPLVEIEAEAGCVLSEVRIIAQET